MDNAPRNEFAGQTKLLFQVALLIFVFTVTVGIMNGSDHVTFSRKAILTHVHVGTLGWITMCVMASSLWMLGDSAMSAAERKLVKTLSLVTAVVIPAYAFTFFLTFGTMRPAMGTLALLVITAFFVWAASRMRKVTVSVPRLALFAALATSFTGAILGVLLGLQFAGDIDFMPSGIKDAHPATMVVGFLVPVGMGLAEWGLLKGRCDIPATRAGKFQVGLPFTGGVMIMIGTLWDITPLLMLSLPFEIVGIGIFIKRMWPNIRATSFSDRLGGRHFVMSMAYIVINLGILVYLLGRFAGDFDSAPRHTILALDHTMFIGVMTNAIVGIIGATSRRRSTMWPWVEDVLFWGLNIGITGFFLGLLANLTITKQAFTPLMGLSILLAIVTFTARLQLPGGDEPAAEAARAA
jgi:hypothetical protein